MINNMEAIDFVVCALENYKEDGREVQFTVVNDNTILFKLNNDKKYSLTLTNADSIQKLLGDFDRLENYNINT